MNTAQELISIVESRGGRLTVEDGKLVIDPAEAGLPIVDALKAHKPAIMAIIQSRPEDDDVLGLWLLARCVFDDKCAGGVSALFLDFSRWCVSRGLRAPASRQAFIDTLRTEGFTMTRADLWHGLILREDLEAVNQ